MNNVNLQRHWLLAAAIAGAMVSAPAWAAKDAVIAVGSNFTSLDPYDANDTLSQAVAKSFYQGLFGFDKDMKQINGSGVRAASHYPGMLYWEYNWRKGGGSARMIEISKRENFYQQEYCGCVYSLRDTNEHRVSMGRERIHLGVKFYGTVEVTEQVMEEVRETVTQTREEK